MCIEPIPTFAKCVTFSCVLFISVLPLSSKHNTDTGRIGVLTHILSTVPNTHKYHCITGTIVHTCSLNEANEMKDDLCPRSL